MSTVALEPLAHHRCRVTPKIRAIAKKDKPFSLNFTRRPLSYGVSSFCNFKPPSSSYRPLATLRASSRDRTLVETSESVDVILEETFPIKRAEKVEGKILITLDSGKNEEEWQLTVGCTLPGKWILHWGVNYVNDVGSEWDQPPLEMRPPDSIPIKDYAIETLLKKSSKVLEVDKLQEVKIDFNTKSSIAAINFVLKDEETGAWYQHRGETSRCL